MMFNVFCCRLAERNNMKKFLEVAMNKGNKKYAKAISRRNDMFCDIEGNAYKRLRNKTQLFFLRSMTMFVLGANMCSMYHL